MLLTVIKAMPHPVDQSTLDQSLAGSDCCKNISNSKQVKGITKH